MVLGFGAGGLASGGGFGGGHERTLVDLMVGQCIWICRAVGGVSDNKSSDNGNQQM